MSRSKRTSPKLLKAKQPLQRTAYRALALRLKQRAEELGLSVRDLAERLDRPRTTVHKTLCANRRLDPIEFVDWCEALEWPDPLAIIESVRETRPKR